MEDKEEVNNSSVVAAEGQRQKQSTEETHHNDSENAEQSSSGNEKTAAVNNDEQAAAAGESGEAADNADVEAEPVRIPEPDKALLKEQFALFAKFGDKTADGKSIKLSQSDKWFKQGKVIDGKSMSTTDTGIAFRKIAKNNPKLSFAGWTKYLDEIANNKNVDVNGIKTKLVNCGKPGLSGATSVAKCAAVDRLTDTSRYGGTHKQRFDSSGKGRGKEGRADSKGDGYVTGFKQRTAQTTKER